MKCWDTRKSEYIPVPEDVAAFMAEYETLCDKYNLCLGHEDSHGAFLVETYRPELLKEGEDSVLLHEPITLNKYKDDQ